MCIYQQMLVNQGIHWCELQKEIYPRCDLCQCKKETPASTTTSTTAQTVADLKELIGTALDKLKTQ